MISKETIQSLATLVRIQLNDTEASELTQDIQSILQYVDTISSVDIPADAQDVMVQSNITRLDDTLSSHQATADEVLEQVPEMKDRFVSVAPILKR